MNKFDQGVPKTIYRLAEAHRLFKCKPLEKIGSLVESFLGNTKNLKEVNELYYGLLLQNRAKEYGIKPSTVFKKHLATLAKDTWLKNFDANDWSYNSATKD